MALGSEHPAEDMRPPRRRTGGGLPLGSVWCKSFMAHDGRSYCVGNVSTLSQVDPFTKKADLRSRGYELLGGDDATHGAVGERHVEVSGQVLPERRESEASRQARHALHVTGPDGRSPTHGCDA